MAEVNSIFRVKGRIGNTIFSGRNGKCYARAVATSVKNPNTPIDNKVNHRKYSLVSGCKRQEANVPEYAETAGSS